MSTAIDAHVLQLTQAELDELRECSTSVPSGVTNGKRWKRDLAFPIPGVRPQWVIGEYYELDAGQVGIRWYNVEIVDKHPNAEQLAVARDAERWRALINSERIRIIGSARLGERSGMLSLEVWGQHRTSIPVNPEVQALARRSLTAFVDGLR